MPIVAKIIDNKLIVTKILDSIIVRTDSVKIGDIIIKINNREIKDIVANQRNLIGASNEASFLNKIIEPILSVNADTVKIDFIINNKNVSKTINCVDFNKTKYQLENESVTKLKKVKFKILDKNVGYVNLGELSRRNIPDMSENLKATKAIIFDLRNYPNDILFDIANFLNSREQVFATYTTPDLKYPGRFKWVKGDTCGTNSTSSYCGKVVVLLNEDSVSQSEWTAMGLKTAGNTTIIGSQTGGADGNVSGIDFIKQIHTQFTGIGVYYPDRTETQRIGIIPDIEVKPTITGIQMGRDEVLERALQFIETGK